MNLSDLNASQGFLPIDPGSLPGGFQPINSGELPLAGSEGSPLSSLSGLSSLLGGGIPPLNLQASARADSKASSSAYTTFQTGAFNVGGSGGTNLNVILIVAGVIALAFLFLNRKGKK